MQNKYISKAMLFCIAVLVLFFITFVIRSITTNILVRKLHMNNLFTQMVLYDNEELQQVKVKNKDKSEKIDWSKEYPFTLDNPINVDDKSINFVKNNAQNKTYNSFNETLWEYYRWVAMSKEFKNFIDWKIYIRGPQPEPVNLQDNYWVNFQEKQNVTKQALTVVELNNVLKEKNTRFLLFMAPGKIRNGDNRISGILDFSNQNADDFLSTLKDNNVDYIDYRDFIDESSDSSYRDMFYKTDHHWKPITGMHAVNKVGEHLNQQYGYHINLELLNPNLYDRVQYDKVFLGSLGRKATLAEAMPEDFSIYQPKFYSNIHYEVPEEKVNITGDLSILYDMKQLERIDYYNLNPYSAYNYGDKALIHVKNNNVNDGKRLLVIKNSYANPMTFFLSTGVDKMDIIDLRLFNGSLQTYIDKYEPDTVLFIVHTEWLTLYRPIYSNDHTGFWDFR